MFLNYKEKVQQLYKFQVHMFQGFGVYHLPSDTTKMKKLVYELYFIVAFFCVGAYNLCVLLEFFAQPTILDKIVNVFFGLAAFIASMFKLFYLKKDASLYQKPVALLTKDIFVPINANEDDILSRNILINKRVRIFYGWVSLLALIYVLLMNKITHPHELPIAAYTPNEINFMVVEIYSYVLITYMCLINIAYDSWCTAFLIFAKTQLELLRYRLEGTGSNTSSNLAINRELKKCIYHHAELIKFVKIIERAMSLPVSVQIFCSISVLCCNFYAMSFTSIEDDISKFLTFFIYQMAMLSQIFLLCYFSNEVTLESLKLSYALYCSNWVTWNKINRKLMLLTMLRFQTPLFVRSINRCYAFNLITFTSIVNSSYSYFALLKQINN